MPIKWHKGMPHHHTSVRQNHESNRLGHDQIMSLHQDKAMSHHPLNENGHSPHKYRMDTIILELLPLTMVHSLLIQMNLDTAHHPHRCHLSTIQYQLIMKHKSGNDRYSLNSSNNAKPRPCTEYIFRNGAIKLTTHLREDPWRSLSRCSSNEVFLGYRKLTVRVDYLHFPKLFKARKVSIMDQVVNPASRTSLAECFQELAVVLVALELLARCLQDRKGHPSRCQDVVKISIIYKTPQSKMGGTRLPGRHLEVGEEGS